METVATMSATVDDYIHQLKQDLYSTDYGKVGIEFTISNDQVTYVKRIREKQYQLSKTVDETL